MGAFAVNLANCLNMLGKVYCAYGLKRFRKLTVVVSISGSFLSYLSFGASANLNSKFIVLAWGNGFVENT
jgi:hypothetical protein